METGSNSTFRLETTCGAKGAQYARFIRVVTGILVAVGTAIITLSVYDFGVSKSIIIEDSQDRCKLFPEQCYDKLEDLCEPCPKGFPNSGFTIERHALSSFDVSATYNLGNLIVCPYSSGGTVDFAKHANVESSMKLLNLPKRSKLCPYVAKLDFACPQTSLKCGHYDDILDREDILWVREDLGDHMLCRDGEVVRGVTVPPIARVIPDPLLSEQANARRYQLSFQGQCQGGWHTCSNVRPMLKKLFDGFHSDAVHFRCTERNTFSDEMQRQYSESMNATFILSPHGDGRWNYRFSETILAGAIPVVIADGLTLPFDGVIDWINAIVRISEKELKNFRTPQDLLEMLPSGERLESMLQNVKQIRKNYFINDTVREKGMRMSIERYLYLESRKMHAM